MLLVDHHLTGETLAHTLTPLLDVDRLRAMAHGALSLKREGAASAIAREVLRVGQ